MSDGKPYTFDIQTSARIAGPVYESAHRPGGRANIISEWYFTALNAVWGEEDATVAIEDEGKFCLSREASSALGRMTICILVMDDGSMVLGHSVCHDYESTSTADRWVEKRWCRGCTDTEKARARESAVANFGAQ